MVRRPFGLLGYYLGFEPPSDLAVMECLYEAKQPKNVASQHGTAQDEWLAFGISGELVTDRGKEFKGASLQDACDSLDIRLNIGLLSLCWCCIITCWIT